MRGLSGRLCSSKVTAGGNIARQRDLLCSGVAALSLAIAAGDALAQDASSTTLDPVVVVGEKGGAIGPDATVVATESATATKTDTPIVDIPASISVVTEKEMEERGVQNLQQAISYTSGVLVDEFGSDNRYDYFRIRGFDQTALGTYRDGLPARIPAWYTSSRLETYGLQRVEVLKGSTSTLFGLNAPGGLINAITKRPQDTAFGEVYTTLWEGHTEFGADVGGPIDTDGVWKYRLTGLWQNGDYYNYDYTNDDRFYIAPALTISPDAGTSLTILTDYSKREGTGARGYPMGVSLDLNTFLGEPDFNHFDTQQGDVGYLFDHQFGEGFTFRSSARYTHINLNYEEVYGASVDPTIDRQAFSVYSNASRFTIDNQLQYDSSWKAFDSTLLVGVDYTHDNTHEDIKFGSASGIDIFNPVYCGRECIELGPYVNWRVRQNAAGIYAQEQLTFDDRWILTLGGRYDNVSTKADYLDTGLEDSDTAHDFTKRVGLTYKFNPGLAVYANYSESFQPLVTPTANGYAVTDTLKPQEGTQYEVGVKYQPDSFDGLFTLAWFDLSQTNVPTYVNELEQRQIGEVNVKGIEFEGKVALNSRLNLILSYSYWDAEIVEDGATGNAGNRPDRVPEHIASAWVDYTIPGNGIFGDLTLGGGLRFVGQTYADPENTISIDPHTVFDASVKYQITDQVALSVTATNLLDKEYISTCYYGTCYYGDPREVYATLKYTW